MCLVCLLFYQCLTESRSPLFWGSTIQQIFLLWILHLLSLLTNIFLSQVIKYFLQYVLLDFCIFKLCICTYLAFSLFQNITNFFELPVWQQAFLSPFFWHRRVSACVSSTSEENLSLDFKLLGCLVASGLL